MDKKEELLVLKTQRGNIQAFEELVHLYDRRVMKVVLSMVAHPEDARDIYQEIFIKVYQSINKFRCESNFFTWLFRITINTCINHRRKKGNQFLESIDKYDEQNWIPANISDSSNPERQFINQELNLKIQQAIDKLSSQQKTVFILRHYNGLKLKEIAEIMECAEGTVKNYLFRAVQKLQLLLKEYKNY